MHRVREHPVAAAFGAAVGLGIAWATLQSSVSYSGWRLGPIPILLIVIGCPIWGMLVSLSPLPGAIVRRTAYMYGDGLIPRTLITASFAAIPAIVWGIALVDLFGTRSGR